MKPLPIEEQIRILRRVLWLPFINDGMCLKIYDVACALGYIISPIEATDIIPTFNRIAYLEFYSKVESVRNRNNWSFWDNNTLLGSIRRRRFIRHLIKELEKQL